MSAVMQPTGNEVSREALDEVRRTGRATSQYELVLTAIMHYGPSTRQQLAERTGLPLCSVCPRVHELLDTDHLTVMGVSEDPRPRQVLDLTAKGVAEWTRQQAVLGEGAANE